MNQSRISYRFFKVFVVFKEDKDFYRICVDTFLEGICITDRNGVIVMNNIPLEEMFGYASGELLNKNIEILIPERYRKINLNYFRQFIRHPKKFKKGLGRDLYGLHKNGKIIHIEVGLNYFEYKGELYAKALISDVSLRKKREKEIRKINLGLEREVKNRNRELTQVVDQLKNTNKQLKQEVQKKNIAENKAQNALQVEKELNILQTRFLSMASHEFKTPLSGILTSVSLIEKYNSGKIPKIDTHVQTIKKLVNQFNVVLDDFLHLEKAETTEFNYTFEHFYFCEFFKEIISTVQSVKKNGQHIELEPCPNDVKVYQDKKIVALIFRNILYNAIKYSPENSVVTITVKPNEHLTVTIKDEGIGIPEADHKHIFERFFRARNALHVQGTGIGLNIVKQHIENLGGTIAFKSRENKGTVFTLKIPVEMKYKTI